MIGIDEIDKRVTEEWMKKRIYLKLQQKIGDKNEYNLIKKLLKKI